MALQEKVQQAREALLGQVDTLSGQVKSQLDEARGQAEGMTQQIKDQADGMLSQFRGQLDGVNAQFSEQLETVKKQAEGLTGQAQNSAKQVRGRAEALRGQATELTEASLQALSEANEALTKGLSNLGAFQRESLKDNVAAVSERLTTARKAKSVKDLVEGQTALWPQTKERQLAYLNKTVEMFRETVEAVSRALQRGLSNLQPALEGPGTAKK